MSNENLDSSGAAYPWPSTLWQMVIQAAPQEAIHGSRDNPAENGWLYTLANEMKTDTGMAMWEQLCNELDRRERETSTRNDREVAR